MAQIETLIEDINGLFDGRRFSSANLDRFALELTTSFEKKFKRFGDDQYAKLYLSMIGKPLRQLWWLLHAKVQGEELPANKKLNFLYGDIIEDLMTLLIVEAGHTITDMQKLVEIDGVTGRIDGLVDGVLVDVKSTSTRSFEKFQHGSLSFDDGFGYIGQLAAYRSALGVERAAFLAIDKQLGHICLLEIPKDILDHYDARGRIAEIKAAVASDVMPPCCCTPIPEGKSGNEILPTLGSYCPYKKHCYPQLRTFLYSSGPKFFTKVAAEPRVHEITST